MGNTVTHRIHFNYIGAAVVIVIICAGVYVAFYAVIVGMHFIGCNVVAAYVFMHKKASL